MKRMVDDKEIREFDDRITALEQGGTGGTTYNSGEFIYVDNQEKTVNLYYTNSNTIEFDTFDGRLWPKVKFGDGLNADQNGLYVNLSNLNQPVTTNNYNGYTVRTTSGGNTYISKFSSEELHVTKPYYSASYETTGIDYYLDQFNDQHYPTININAGQPGQTAITHINIPHNPVAGTTANYTLLAIDSDENLNQTLIRVNQIAATDGEDTDNKGKIYFNSGIHTGSVELEAGGEESSASLLVRGTSAVGSEGLIQLHGETQIYTDNRINVFDSNSNTEQIAYLSDISSQVSTYQLALGTPTMKLWFATITAESGLEGTYGQTDDEWYTFIQKHAKYVSWFYINDNDTTNNHKTFIMTTPGQTLLFYDMMGSSFVPVIPPTSAELIVTKTN